MSVVEQVREFHGVFDQPIKDTPGVPADARVRLRARLMAEELVETLGALFSSADSTVSAFADLRIALRRIIEKGTVEVDLVELADGLADLDYVVEGTRLEFGIDGGPVADEVHRSNMAKAIPCPSSCVNGRVPHYFEGRFNGGWEDCPTCKSTGLIVKKRDDDKVTKPESWTPPDIAGILRRQGWER